MVSEADHLHHVRDEIRKFYDKSKKVIVAPSRCKLYISRCTKIIDSEGKTSPNWVYFATGLTTIINDSETNEVMLTLFDTDSTRLLWMLKLNENTHIYAPNSCFHVVNTRDDFNQHVGFLYENKEVAELLLNTFTLLTSQNCSSSEANLSPNTNTQTKRFQTKTRDAEKSEENSPPLNTSSEKKRKSLLRSLTFRTKRDSNPQTTKSPRGKSCLLPDTISPVITTTVSVPDRKSESFINDYFKRNENERRRRRSGSRSKTLGPESIPNASYFTKDPKGKSQEDRENKRSSVPYFVVGEVEDIFPSRETIISSSKSRMETPRNSISERPKMLESERFSPDPMALQEDIPADCNMQVTKKRRSIFKRNGKKLTRSLSDKLPGRPRINANEQRGVSMRDDADRRYTGKPRASSDSLLLTGSAITCMIESGLMAKYQRERKSWMTILENESVMTTDLCVTEL